MSAFEYRNGQLYAEDVALADVARAHGTPTYVYSRAALERHYRDYADALEGFPHLICYAVKANSSLAVLQVLARQGAGFDIVSQGELERVLAAGGDPAQVVFSGVGKTTGEMQRALEVGIRCFNVESAAELERLSQVAVSLGRTAPVSVRVNPDVDARTHPYISTGLRDNKFGIDIAQAPAVYRRAAALPNIDLIGVDCHIGSQLTSMEPFLDALERVLALVDRLRDEGIPLHHLNLGGGLGVRYRDENPPAAGEYMARVRQRLAGRSLTLVVEPGRSISANAGLLLTRVEYLKDQGERHFCIVDAAMNDLLRPALYQAWMAIEPVRPRPDPPRTMDVVGPVCETADFLGQDRELAVQVGDLLGIHGAGAYGFSMSSNYNSRPRAAEVMVDGDRCHLVRTRETHAELMRGESVLPG